MSLHKDFREKEDAVMGYIIAKYRTYLWYILISVKTVTFLFRPKQIKRFPTKFCVAYLESTWGLFRISLDLILEVEKQLLQESRSPRSRNETKQKNCLNHQTRIKRNISVIPTSKKKNIWLVYLIYSSLLSRILLNKKCAKPFYSEKYFSFYSLYVVFFFDYLLPQYNF